MTQEEINKEKQNYFWHLTALVIANRFNEVSSLLNKYGYIKQTFT